MTNLTASEIEVLEAINNSDYGSELGDPIWSWDIADNCPNLVGKQISGVVSSLSQKGLVGSCKDGNDSTTWLTPEGIEVCKQNNLLGKFA